MVHESASSNSAKSSCAAPPKEALLAFGGVTIKQEKITPPSSPTRSSLNGTYITPVGGGGAIDDKSLIGPIKSSTEILGELFQAFDAEVPDGLDRVTSARKKHKKEKKSKKSSRNKERHGEDGESSIVADSLASEKRKHRHAEKERKRLETKKSSADDQMAAKLLERKRRFESDNGSLPGISKIIKTENPISDADVGPSRNTKIVFKNLKDSEILKNSALSSHRRQSNMDNLSDLSLSDEETYMRQKKTFYRSADRPTANPFYASKSMVPDDEPMYVEQRCFT